MSRSISPPKKAALMPKKKIARLKAHSINALLVDIYAYLIAKYRPTINCSYTEVY